MTRWFSPRRTVLFSHSLSFSSRRIFRVANGKKRNLCRSDENVGEEIASRLTSQMYLGTYDVQKPRRLVNLTDSRHDKKVLQKFIIFVVFKKFVL